MRVFRYTLLLAFVCRYDDVEAVQLTPENRNFAGAIQTCDGLILMALRDADVAHYPAFDEFVNTRQ